MGKHGKMTFSMAGLLAAEAAMAGTPRVELESVLPVTRLTAQEIQSLPSRALDVSLLVPGGQTVSVQATTGKDGRLPVRGVPPSQWRRESALLDGTLLLPDNAFGVIRDAAGPSALDVQALEVIRQPFGVQYGQIVDPLVFATRAVDPFMLLCRGDEGVPTRLYAGDRFSFEAPSADKPWDWPKTGLSTGSQVDFGKGISPQLTYRDATLRQLQAGPLGTLPAGDVSSWRPDLFPLPDHGGFNLGIDAGADPLKTRGILTDLSLKGAIRAFEPDPCWKYYPNGPILTTGAGCAPREEPFEQKAIRYSDSIQAVLKDPYTGKPISGAWVDYRPISPNPFHDPGEQPGDELPPTFTRTGPDGGYRISLDGLSGPFEVHVAQGCNSHTTVAIADTPGQAAIASGTRDAGGTRTRDGGSPTSSGGGDTPASTPEEKPPEGLKVCGPDITDYILGTLQFMVETFSQWDEATKDEKCSTLYGPHADGAWEMRHMGPFDSDRGKDPYLYFARYVPDRCAVPRSPCGATVQFLGVCLDAQIVNYVAWGAMNQLCDNQGIGMLAHLVRDRAVNIYRGIREAIGNKSPSRLKIGKGAAYDAQDAMSAVGELFVKEHTGLAGRKALLEQLVKVYVRQYPDIAKTEGFDCQLICGKYAPDIRPFDNFSWGFCWGLGQWYDKRGSQLARP